MPRPPPSTRGEIESNDSRSYGGLADVLEPDASFDESDDWAITSMRSLGVASVRSPSLRAGRAAQALSVRAPLPVQVQDFAFADTVFANKLDDPPPSGPIFVNDPLGNTQCVTPLAFPLPPPSEDFGMATRLRVLTAHVRHAIRGAREEMRDLWAVTYEMVASAKRPTEPGAMLVLRRVLALWSCFQWSRADLTRAAMIGLAVFVAAGAIGATTIDFDDGGASGTSGASFSATRSSSEVRARRTLDQHTDKKLVRRAKR